MKYFHKELIAKEACFSYKRFLEKEEGHKNFSANESTFTNSYYSQKVLNNETGYKNQQQKCIFCHKDYHPPSHCKIVTKKDARIDILRKYSKCYLCLKGGHISKICKSSYFCRKCGGKHYISICKFEEKNDNSQAVVSHVELCRTILLQTARASVLDLDNKSSCNTTILFDTGSQRSFITENVRKRSRLKTVLSVFDDCKESHLENLDVVEFKIKHRFENSYSVVEALVYPLICCEIKGQLVSLAKEQYDHISRLTLADFEDQNERFSVGVLTGVDFYHKFFLEKIIKGPKSPGASSSVFGWILSSPVELDPSVATNLSFITGHILRCSTGPSKNELKEDLSRFWSVEDLTNSEKTCVTREFEQDITFNNERYVTKLPFKPDRDSLTGNFKNCEIRLKNLKARLLKENLFDDYKNIFKDYVENKIIEEVPDDEIAKESGSVHYLSHRPVVRQDKETTKIRTVFDASCPYNGTS